MVLCAHDASPSDLCASIAVSGIDQRPMFLSGLGQRFLDRVSSFLDEATHIPIVNVDVAHDVGHRHPLRLDYLLLPLDNDLQVFDVLLRLHARHLHGAQDDEYQYGPVSVT